MLRNLAEYHWAEHIDDALLLLARLDVKTVPLAGGTYLLGLDDESIEAVVDLRELELAYVGEDAQGLRIGAMTTLQNLVNAPATKNFASGLLARAAQVSSSSRIVRNSATIGGTLGAGITSQADLLTALSALEARVMLRSGSRTSVNLSGGTEERPGLALSGVVFKGKQERTLSTDRVLHERRPDELMVEVVIPPIKRACGASFMRVGRTQADVALLNVAALVELEQGTYRRVRVAFGGVNMEPMRLLACERLLEGKQMDDTQSLLDAVQAGGNEFRPPTDALVSAGYRRGSATKLAQRVLEEAIYNARLQDANTDYRSSASIESR
jgi:CO/xanthine dehydrogenase FAD-binding subunit